MKLKRAYIYSFGKFKDFSIEFDSGLNVINHENGWGKSTIAFFIKSMFYGLSGSNKHSVKDNERKKFRPWNSMEKFGGSLEFEFKGRNFKIERFFGSKDSEDTVRLFDLDTGVEGNSFNLGERIFGINEEGFLSTTYVSQSNFEGVASAGLTAKFNEQSLPEDAKEFELALSLLEKKAKSYKALKGEKGELNEIEEKIRISEYKRENAIKNSTILESLKVEVSALTEKNNALEKQIESVSSSIKNAARLEAVRLKKEKYARSKEKKSQLDSLKYKAHSVIGEKRFTDQDLSTLAESIKDYNSLLEKEKTYKEILEKDTPLAINKKPNFNPFLLCLGGALACAGIIVLILASLLFGALICFFGAICFALAFVIKSKTPAKQNLLNQTAIDYKKVHEHAETGRKMLEDYFSFLSTGGDFLDKLKEIEKAENTMRIVEEELGEVLKEIEQLEKDSDLNLDCCNISNVEDLENKLSSLRQAFSLNATTLSAKKTALISAEESLSSLFDLESEISRLNIEKKEKTEEYKIITSTIQYLKKADENLKVKYRAPLEESFNNYVSFIDDSANFKARINVDLKVSVDELGANRDKDYFSEGYKNMFEICKRFAVLDVFFENEKPFIILDDPFYNLDDKKIEKALSLLEKLSSKFQILYFICHASRGV